MIHAGELREIIKIQRPERVSNGSGGFETVYVDIIPKTYAKVTEVQASADLIASQENINTLVEFMIRYRPENIKIADVIEWRGHIFKVAQSMKVDPLRTTITITAFNTIEESNRTRETTT